MVVVGLLADEHLVVVGDAIAALVAVVYALQLMIQMLSPAKSQFWFTT